MQGIAYVFLNRDGANGLGHVGGAFLMRNGLMRCFATENIIGKPDVPAEYKSCWIQDCHNNLVSMLGVFQRARSITVPEGVWGIAPGTYSNENKPHLYTDWKMLECDDADPDQAAFMLIKRSQEDYHWLDRNCENDVYDVLHDQGSGYGISGYAGDPFYIGWPTSPDWQIGPNAWFDNHIRANQSGSCHPVTPP